MRSGWLYMFWGGMDLFYVVRFCYLNVSRGNVPLYTDVQSFILLSSEHGVASLVFFLLGIVLNVSIAFSMLLFFLNSRAAPYVAYAQIPLRIILTIPSLSFLFWASKVTGMTSATLVLGLLLLSEIIKFCTIYFRERLRLI
ncbi:arginine:ornithine antiporter [Pseudomonas sp. ERMR1:02]|nr:arginine:ornithine antiporter [Pseudomonas sp. ERMR1:02]